MFPEAELGFSIGESALALVAHLPDRLAGPALLDEVSPALADLGRRAGAVRS
ncbi:hypothetical protein [Streptomyces luteolus]|uniref:IclR-ED domain-containing protein n=1 Tax=Streptomyces luteolus TaxID=3043615 RepID=A0ABT6SSQ7_9ACTN|nr:hypothetical protein [Streptomyces sp. B-S-A12]MDI3418641.1 hypothetical protein [Streptomyces sp. B-S-A12]